MYGEGRSYWLVRYHGVCGKKNETILSVLAHNIQFQNREDSMTHIILNFRIVLFTRTC